MDSNNISNHQNPEGVKRKHEIDDDEISSKKRNLIIDEQIGSSEIGDNVEEILNSIRALPDAKDLDFNEIKKIVQIFEKKLSKNREMRVKNKEMPEKFMDSECELFEILQQCHSLTTIPMFFNALIDLNFISDLLEVLNHDNTDIAATSVELLFEMINSDQNTDYDTVEKITEYLMSNGVFELGLSLLKRIEISDLEESEHVKSSLSLLETLIEIKPELIKKETSESLIEWMLKFLKNDTYHPNMLHVTEILNICLQNVAENRDFFSSINGIETILICVSRYRKRDPVTNDEIEYMQNLFDVICVSLLSESNKAQFILYEGIPLMILVLRCRFLARCGALKVMSFLLSSSFDNIKCCEQFIEYSGLRGLFPLFLSIPSNIKRLGYTVENIEEYSCAIILNLLKYLSGENRSRVVEKFIEKDFLKLDRLFELFIKYNEKVNLINKKIEQTRLEMEADDKVIDDELEEQFYMEKLDAGLFTLQIIVCNFYELSDNKIPLLIERIHKILTQWQIPSSLLSEILKDYIDHLGENDNSEIIIKEKQRLLLMIKNI